MKFDPELKNAISLLSPQEKDKLIMRLLRRDVDLAKRLTFELVSGDSVQDRRAEMVTHVELAVQRMTKGYYSLGCLLMDMRYLSGEITDHLKTTKDKFGEVSLNLLMLNEVLKLNGDRISQSSNAKLSSLCTYIVARTFKVLVLIKALHEDYFIEFEEALIELGRLIGGIPPLMRIAIGNGLDVNWLCRADIPDDIAAILKNIRANGFLR